MFYIFFKRCKINLTQIKGGFSTIHELVDWVAQSFGIHYTQVGMWKLVKRLKIKKKTARPSHVLKDEKAAERFKKTSLS